MRVPTLSSIAALMGALACSAPSSPSATTASTAGTATTMSATSAVTTTAASASLPSVYQQFKSTVGVRVDGTTVVLTSNGVPDHPSPYFDTGNPLYEAPRAGMAVNPNRIVSQNFVLRVPIAPVVVTASDTPLGAIGIATNGVAFFNQYAAGRQPLTFEILSFDRYNGHPQQTGVYHYHMDPFWLTTGHPAAFIGVLLDGFPVYGPKESDGSAPAGLDACNGHAHATADFPQGLYHYHVTSESPYLSGCFRGTPGTAG